MSALKHAHEYSALWSNLGKYGRQDVHYHTCFGGKRGADCDAVLVALGRDCKEGEPHHAHSLTVDAAWKKDGAPL